MKNIYTILSFLFCISFSVKAQEKSYEEKRGDKYVFSFSYQKAIESYNRAKELSSDGQRNLAESYNKVDSNKQAESAYATLVALPSGLVAEDYYKYAMVLKMNGKFEESNRWMDKFESTSPNDLRAKSYTAHKLSMGSLVNDNGRYRIAHLDINSDVEDFGTSFYKNSLVFASTRAIVPATKRKYNWNGKPFLNIFVAEIDKGQLKSPEIFDGSLDGKMHDGPASFSQNGEFMAFTRNHYRDKSNDKIVELQIYFSNFKDGKWTKPEPFIFNNSGYNVGHPSLSADGNTLYFTGELPGGFGGTDLYKSTKDANGAWTKPVNLGNKINTEGNEMFPFFEEKNKTLFFTSNGHFGLGGMDIFKSEVSGNSYTTPQNLGTPMNTKYDDFAAIYNATQGMGYFSSNRKSGSGGDDIYSFTTKKKIIGIAKNKEEKPLENALVTLKDGMGIFQDSVRTKVDGAYTFIVNTDKNFSLTGTKTAYLDGQNTASTFGIEFIVKADVTLLQKEVTAIVKKDIVKKNYAVLPIYFDLDKSNITGLAAEELRKLVLVMNNNPDMEIEIESYTDCRASYAYNQVLSNKRAKSSLKFVRGKISNPARIYGKGFSESKLMNDCPCEGKVVSNCTEEQHQKSRRTEFRIVKNENQ